MEQFVLQERGAKKCGLPSDALYTAPALEMASSSATARLHAALLLPVLRSSSKTTDFPLDNTDEFSERGDETAGCVLEIAAGIGADSQALADVAGSVVCIEADPVHARMLQHNLTISGKRNTLVLRGRAEELLPVLRLQRFDAVFADPARRGNADLSGDGANRNIEVQDYTPPFSLFESLPAHLPVMIKIAPAAEPRSGWDVATVAAGGECKEQLLHRNLGLPPLCAIDAESGARWIPSDRRPGPVVVENPAWLIEPHGAIIRTGAVADYCREQGCEPVDPMIAYGWSDTEQPRSIWHQSFRILRVENFNRKGLQRAVNEFGFGTGTEIKKRGFPDTPEEIRARLRFSGGRNGVIILTRRGGGHITIFAER
jgi:hypothetical protein